jgi:peptidoglycan/xylan/chitin deacetylase (PgdA/CDA1 family)
VSRVTAFVTTSWDDGAVQDLRLAELLAKYRVPACFYIPRDNAERPVLDARSVRELSSEFEIGGHTLRHLRLTTLPLATARSEIREGKQWVEDVTGVPVRSFCYPGGAYRGSHVREVEQAGFWGARTADWLLVDPGADVYRMAPSLQMYRHPWWIHGAHCVRRGHGRALFRYLACFGAETRPSRITRAMLEHIAAHGGVFHLWGHSWEIAEQGLWDELEETLKAIADHPEITWVDNAQLAAHLKAPTA